MWILSLFRNILFKIRLFFYGNVNLVLSRDRAWKKQQDPSRIKDAPKIEKRRIIFIRHGESEWNLVFNKGFGPSFFVRLFKAVMGELFKFPSGDSLFYDTPLSPLGLCQAKHVSEFLQKEHPNGTLEYKDICALKKEANSGHQSVIVTSNLRRAAGTVAIGLWDRVQRTKEQIYVLSSLQEISKNVDCICITPPGQPPYLPRIEKELGPAFSYAHFNARNHRGNKPIFGSNGLKRMRAFTDWCFNQVDQSTTIIAGGHSLYFRSFFQTFLPFQSNHISKKYKMHNGGVVGFTICRGIVNNEVIYCIEPDSISNIFLGWNDKKKKK